MSKPGHGVIELIDAILAEDTRIVRALTRACAKLGCSCTVRTAETNTTAHERFCNYRMAMENIDGL